MESREAPQHPERLYFYGYIRDVTSDQLNTDIFEILIKIRFKLYNMTLRNHGPSPKNTTSRSLALAIAMRKRLVQGHR